MRKALRSLSQGLSRGLKNGLAARERLALQAVPAQQVYNSSISKVPIRLCVPGYKQSILLEYDL